MTNTHAESLRRSLSEATRHSLVDLEFFQAIGSTSTYLLGCENPSPGMMRVAIAEHQTAGRGRRDRAVGHLTSSVARAPAGEWAKRSEAYLKLLR